MITDLLKIKTRQHLRKRFKTAMENILLVIADFTPDERNTLATFTGSCVVKKMLPTSILFSLIHPSLTKGKIAFDFLMQFCTALKLMEGTRLLLEMLKAGNISERLLEFLPARNQKITYLKAALRNKKLNEIANMKIHNLQWAKEKKRKITLTSHIPYSGNGLFLESEFVNSRKFASAQAIVANRQIDNWIQNSKDVKHQTMQDYIDGIKTSTKYDGESY